MASTRLRPVDEDWARTLLIDLRKLDNLGRAVLLDQIWELGSGHIGIKTNPNGTFPLTAARSEFFPPKSWKRVLIPYTTQIVGGCTFFCGLFRPELVDSLTLAKGGLMNVDIYNSTEEVVYLTPETVLADILGAKVFIQEFGRKCYAPRSSIYVLQVPMVGTHSWKRKKQRTATLVGPMTLKESLQIRNNRINILLPYQAYTVTQRQVNAW